LDNNRILEDSKNIKLSKDGLGQFGTKAKDHTLFVVDGFTREALDTFYSSEIHCLWSNF